MDSTQQPSPNQDTGSKPPSGDEVARPLDFVRAAISEDLRSGRFKEVVTRFPPEPNGYLHIGHAKALCLDFGVAQEFGGRCHLRFDDTNPLKEEEAYVEAIKEDIHWLGWDWGEHLYYASDYFERLYQWAEQLILAGKAYVCDLSAEQVREYRGTLTQPGRESPYRNRSVEENLDLFRRMRAGEFPDGSRTLRAKIDMAAPNLNLRDPVMYRILHARHHRTGDRWCIYPTYDWAHGQSDSIEGISHSLCSLEFEDHRVLYDWFLDQLGVHHPRQIEFARFNLSYTVMSKRKLLRLVNEGHVEGWNDPRLPTLSGLRRRGYPPEAIRAFIEDVGVAKRENTIDIALLEHHVRQALNRTAPRVLAVLRPLKLIIDNYPGDQVEWLDAVNNPEDPSAGVRQVPFCRELYIDCDDYMDDPPPGYYRLSPGRRVRLRWAYIVNCTDVVRDGAGQPVEVHCVYDPATRGGAALEGPRVKGTIHWVSARHAFPAEVRLYDRLFSVPDPDDCPPGLDFTFHLNPNSLQRLTQCLLEPSVAGARAGDLYQFERLGYFCVDPVDSVPGNLVFNRVVGLRDTWARLGQKTTAPIG